MPPAVALPTFESQLPEIAGAERGGGWLSLCEKDGQFLVLTRELATALARLLRPLGEGPILEVCAGRGELAQALRPMDVQVVPTDKGPPDGSRVIRASAEEALGRYHPKVVLGSFVPIDAGVDELVMSFSSVRHYVVLGARIGGLFGCAALWRNPGWTSRPLPEVTRRMLTRHDVWIGKPQQPIVQHGEAWHFRRNREQ